MVAFSDDEGETWSEPKELPRVLMGERHKAIYCPESGRLVVTYRDIRRNEADDAAWIAGDWYARVGRFEDLEQGLEGQYRVRLMTDHTPTARAGDCGYAGLEALPDGTLVMAAYGQWDPEQPKESFICSVRWALRKFDALRPEAARASGT